MSKDRMSVDEYKRAIGVGVTPTEEEECAWLFQWAQLTHWHGEPIADVLVHVPNGAYLGADPKTRGITMGKLKAMGLQPGVFDYLIPVLSLAPQKAFYTKPCPGLWLEMKRTKGGTVSDEQKSFRARMEALGWRCEIAKGWIEASKLIAAYLQECEP